MTFVQAIHKPIDLLMRIENRFIRFLFVGVINTLVGYTLFILCRWVRMERAVAVLVSTVLAVTFNYHSTGKLVFENKGYSVILQFFVVYGIMYAVNLAELHFLAESGLYEWLIGIDGGCLNIVERFSLAHDKVGDAIGQLIVVLPNAIMTFLLNKTFVFSRNKKNQ